MAGKTEARLLVVKKLNAEDNKSKLVAKMKVARTALKIVLCRKLIWAIGGEGMHDILNSIEYYDDVTDKWDLLTPMRE